MEKVWGCSLAKLCALPKFEALFCAEYFDKFNLSILAPHRNESMLCISNFGNPVRFAKEAKVQRLLIFDFPRVTKYS